MCRRQAAPLPHKRDAFPQRIITLTPFFPILLLVLAYTLGLGLEICRQLGTGGRYGRVYALCRISSPELNQLANFADSKVSIVEGVDLVNGGDGNGSGGGYESVLAKSLPSSIALLVHNAGAYGPPEETFADSGAVYASQTLDNITPERMSYAFQLNSMAPLFLTQHLLPNLRANQKDDDENDGTKIIIISSLMGSLTDNDSGGHYAYRAAKAAANMIGKSLSVDLSDERIAVGMVHPGFVHTGFGTGDPHQAKRPGQRNVQESTRGVVEAINGVTIQTTGRFWHGNYGEGVKELQW